MKNIDCYCKELDKEVNVELNFIYPVGLRGGKFANGYNAGDRHYCCKHIKGNDKSLIRFNNCKYIEECEVGKCRHTK
ncbi:hypothetical protein [Clostridium sp.]|uniref:hypothetical protein n=1 Tax=Clostridium sp. TaxID=1506 RepID=UPI002911D901|nr:hypothetical protein [Clostridium sp.]MDU4589929.1 hypothetical protein [Clostridium sp.]